VIKGQYSGVGDNKGKLPRPFRLVIDSADHSRLYMDAARGDPAAAAGLAMDAACAAARRLAELAAPFDAFDVLESVRLSQVPTDPETYRETEHDGSAAALSSPRSFLPHVVVGKAVLSERKRATGRAPTPRLMRSSQSATMG
jgi:hypothetical protein